MKIIRLTLSEYKQIDLSKKYLTLFYFKNTTNKKGEIYTLAKILKFGKRSLNGKEIPPVLSFNNVIKVKCVKVVNALPYKQISNKMFKFSLMNIRDIDSLKKSIKRRYLKSRPFLSEKDIEQNGVAYTILEII